jgi:hypothetical protein
VEMKTGGGGGGGGAGGGVEAALSVPASRHCARDEAVQGVLLRLWIASLRSQ